MDKSILERARSYMSDDPGSPVETIDGKPIKAPLINVDADTLKDDQGAYRIQGINAPEVAKITEGVYLPNQFQVDTSQEDINRIARLAGTTELKTAGKDAYNRTLVRQINPETKQSLDSVLVQSGYQKPRADSSDEDVGRSISIKAFAQGFGTADPIMETVNASPMVKDAKYAPKLDVNTAADYAAFKKGFGPQAAAKEAEEVRRLEKILREENLNPDTRKKLEGELESAKQNIYLAMTTPDFVGGVVRSPTDRNIMNEAHDQLSTSFERGLLDLQKMVFGVGELVGDEMQWEALSEISKQKIAATNLQSKQLAATLSSFRDINTKDTWSTISDTALYAGNLIAGALPTMAAIVASAAATGGVGLTGLTALGVSSAPIALLYSGGFYAEQPEDKKNAELAVIAGIGAGVLDRIGLEGMVLRNNLFSMAGQKEAIAAIAKNKGVDEATAKALLEEASKKEILELTKFGAEFAEKQFKSREAYTRALALMGVRSGAEGITETGQTYLELQATKGEWNPDIQYERDFTTALIDSAIGGATVGGIFSAGAQSLDAANWQSAAGSMAQYQGELNEAAKFQDAFRDKYTPPAGEYNYIKQAAKTVKTDPEPAKTNKQWYKSWQDFPVAEGAWNAVKSIVSMPTRLVRQHATATVPTVMNEDGTIKENLGVLKAIMGGYGLLPGDHYAAAKQRQMGRWAGATAEELASAMGTTVKAADMAVQSAWINYWSKGEKLPINSEKDLALQSWKDKLDDIRSTMEADLQANGQDSSEVANPNALFEAPTVSPRLLAARRSEIEDFLRKEGASRRTAKDAVDMLLSKNPEKVQQARNYMASKGVFSTPELADIFETNIFTSIENLKELLSNRIVNEQYLGKDGIVLQRLINKAYQAGEINETQLPYLVKDVKDWYEMINGEYHPLTKYPKLEKILGWGTTLTMMAFLGKAAISSQVEAITSLLGTPGDKIAKQLQSYGYNFVKEIKSDINKMNSYTFGSLSEAFAREMPDKKIQEEVRELTKQLLNTEDDVKATALTEQINKLYERQIGRRLFERLGYNETGYNTQARFEYGDATNMRRAMHAFATAIGLRAQTDALRMAALSVSADIVLGKLIGLSSIPPEQRAVAFASGRGLTEQQAQDVQELMQWGMDINSVLEHLSTAKDMFARHNLENLDQKLTPFEEHILGVLGNMVDGKVMNPQAHNIPKYFNDPRLRILTAMQRFVATATAVLLPRLYLQYIKNGSVGMRYQGFSIIAGTLLASFLINALKDELSYGEDSPYVNGVWKNTQRALYTSGMLGQLERIPEAISPVYPDRKKDFVDAPLRSTWNLAAENSPVLAWSERPVRAVLGFAEGDLEQGVKQTVKAAPVFGSFPRVADVASSPFKEE